MKLKKINLFLLLFLFLTPATSEELEALKNEHQYSFYTGTFDLIDKEGDDKTSLFGFEHQNPDLFRNTFFGKFIAVSLCWTFSFHILNELRHLIWDLGYGFDLNVSKITGVLALFGSFIFAILFYLLGKNIF